MSEETETLAEINLTCVCSFSALKILAAIFDFFFFVFSLHGAIEVRNTAFTLLNVIMFIAFIHF